ncbi:MAG: hypothetical protein IJ960_05770 [Oscillospiraceae bacterium]|nr:hypothetical protein [Oscillospiraceae bacterium]
MKRNIPWIVMLGLLLTVTVCAAETGSLRIEGLDYGAVLQYVATPDGVLTEPFSEAPVKELSNQLFAVENARILYEFALERGIPGQTGERDEAGDILYEALPEGLYLVYSTEAEAEFNPFFVRMPTVINGEADYDIEAAPKLDEDQPTEPSDPTGPSAPSEPTMPSDPSEPTTPTQPDDPDIPETGVVQWPKYLLLGLGALAVLTGCVDCFRGRRSS